MDRTSSANRRWDHRMVRFLVKKRRQGYPIRWIAERLGVSLVRAVAQAINRGLVMHTAYRGRRCLTPREADLEPLGAVRDLPEEGTCRWMNANPDEAWAMCARPTEGGAWCDHHRALVFAKRRRAGAVPHPSPRADARGATFSRLATGEGQSSSKISNVHYPSPAEGREKVASAERARRMRDSAGDEGQPRR